MRLCFGHNKAVRVFDNSKSAEISDRPKFALVIKLLAPNPNTDEPLLWPQNKNLRKDEWRVDANENQTTKSTLR